MTKELDWSRNANFQLKETYTIQKSTAPLQVLTIIFIKVTKHPIQITSCIHSMVIIFVAC